MKKLLVFLVLLLVILVGGYFWLLSQGSPDNADQTFVTTDLPVKGPN